MDRKENERREEKELNFREGYRVRERTVYEASINIPAGAVIQNVELLFSKS